MKKIPTHITIQYLQESSGGSIMSLDHHGSIRIEESFTLNSTEDLFNQKVNSTNRKKEQQVIPINVPTYRNMADVSFSMNRLDLNLLNVIILHYMAFC